LIIYVQYIDALSDKELHRAVKLNISKKGEVKVTGWGLNFVTHISALTFSQRIGDIPRHITFANGSIGYSSDNDKIDKILKRFNNPFSFFKLFKSILKYLLILIIIGAIILGFILAKDTDYSQLRQLLSQFVIIPLSNIKL